MPDPLLYLAAMAAAAGAGLAVLLALQWWAGAARIQDKSGPNRANRWQAVVGIAAGLAAGYCVLRLRVSWPPVNGLDRLLTIVLPAAVIIEFLAALPKTPPWLAWSMRMTLVALLGRVVLHGSVYLSGGWTWWQAAGVLAACAAATAAVWILLLWLAERSPPGASISIALAMTLFSAGGALLLAGYVSGGAASLPLAATLVGTAAAWQLSASRCNGQAAIGIGVVGLSGLLMIGNFYGGLSTGVALVLLSTPLLCWTTELPQLRGRGRWFVGSLRLLLVAIPLAVILALAKLDFDRNTAPLLHRRVSPTQIQARSNRTLRSSSSSDWLAATAALKSCSPRT